MGIFMKILQFVDTLDIKETIVLKLMIKKANILLYLGKINHADEAIHEAQERMDVIITI